MRPSNYHYIKRMWTRECCNRNGGCFTNILLFPFKIIIFIFKPIFMLFGSSKNKNKADYFESRKKEYERMQILDVCSYGAEFVNDELSESIEYKTFMLLIKNPSVGFIQKNYKIGFNHAIEILRSIEELGAIKIEEDFKIKILMDRNDFVKALNKGVMQNEN